MYTIGPYFFVFPPREISLSLGRLGGGLFFIGFVVTGGGDRYGSHLLVGGGGGYGGLDGE